MMIDLRTHLENSELSGHALAALQEFYAEKDVQQKRFDEVKAAAGEDRELSMNMFSEDWNASQFWVRMLDFAHC